MTVKCKAQSMMTVHYNRLRGDYEGWTLWVWNEFSKQQGFEVVRSGLDSYGAVFSLDFIASGLDGGPVGLLPRYKNWEDKDGPDRLLEKAAPGEVFICEGDPVVYSDAPEVPVRIVSASLESRNEIKLVFNRQVDWRFIMEQDFCAVNGDNILRPVKSAFPDCARSGRSALLSFDKLGSPCSAELNSGLWKINSGTLAPAAVGLGAAVYGADFSSDKEMGLRVSEGKTFIRVFAPFASGVEALFRAAPDSGAFSARALAAADSGLWETVIPEDLTGRYWKFRISQGGKTYEGLDPYARSVTAHNGLALVGNDASPVSPGPVFDLSETVIYELNLRDFTIDGSSGVRERGKYLGLTETGTVHPEYGDVRTGIDHLTELGVNAVHIMPFQDFENEESAPCYNWGYMTVNFNSPEGWYATGLYGEERVRESKAMIDALHRKNIKVIMDVVYNHTAEAGGKIFNFNAMAKDYYYRLREDGAYWNGSGCGNEFKSESPMGRKFIIDSLLHWLKEYKVDGFRFDLMGLLDKDTVIELVRRLKEAKPDIIIYGEPWAAGPTPVEGVYKGFQRSKGFSVFNDGLRDALKGGAFNVSETGYVQTGANRGAVMSGIKGSIDDFAGSPLESVNYVSCHDNHTLWDRLMLLTKPETQENRVRMDKLAQAVVLTSQGIPFIHSGEEFLRTKNGECNSYNLPDAVNRIDWTLKKTNKAVFSFYRDLIMMRKSHPAFRMATAGAVRENLQFYEDLGFPVSEPNIAYQLKGAEAGDRWGRIVVLINPRKISQQFVLPPGEYKKAFDENGACAGDRKFTGFIDVPALSMTVVYK